MHCIQLDHPSLHLQIPHPMRCSWIPTPFISWNFYAILADISQSSSALQISSSNKNDPLVDQVDLQEADPTYAHVRYLDGRESTIFLRDLAPCPCIPVDVGHAQPPPIWPEGISQTDIFDTNLTISLTIEISEPYSSQALRHSTQSKVACMIGLF